MTSGGILVGVDKEGRSLEAARLASGLARALGTGLRVLHVLEQTHRPWTHAEPLHEALLVEVCESALADVRNALPHTTGYHYRQGHPVREILEEIRENEPELVVLGRHHRGLLDAFVGGTAIGVVRRVDTPVLVHKDLRTEPPSSLLACVDLSEAATCALEVAIEWARLLEADLQVLYVFEPPAFCYDAQAAMPNYSVEAIMKAEREGLDALLGRTDWRGVAHDVRFEVGVPGPTILEIATAGEADLVVVGSHGRTGLDRVFMGSVSEYVVRQPDRSVLVVRPPRGS